MSKAKRKKNTGETEGHVKVFLISSEYDQLGQEPKCPQLIMSAGELEELESQHGLSYVPRRWLKHEEMRSGLPFLFLGSHIIGLITPAGELNRIRGIKEEAILLGSLGQYPELVEARDKFCRAWDELQEKYKAFLEQLEVAKKNFGKSD